MRYRRDRMAGGCYFFTVVTHSRQPVLTIAANIERLRESLRREKERHPFIIDALVVLPEHLHCLWRLPEGNIDYSGRWGRIKRFFSAGCCGVTATSLLPHVNQKESGLSGSDGFGNIEFGMMRIGAGIWIIFIIIL